MLIASCAKADTEFLFEGLWADNGYNPQLKSVPTFLGISRLTGNAYLVVMASFTNSAINQRGIGRRIEMNKLKVNLGGSELIIEGVRKNSRDNLLVYMRPGHEFTLTFGRPKDLNRSYLVE
jgi:hypothetical protein